MLHTKNIPISTISLHLLSFLNSINGVRSFPTMRTVSNSSRIRATRNGDPASTSDTDTYIVIDDMIIRKDQTRAGIVDLNWPKGIVPIDFDDNIGPQQRLQIMQAMKNISSTTCIQFPMVRSEDTYSLKYTSYPEGCESHVGWQNEMNQLVKLSSRKCSFGNIIHEIIHALGFFHEHTRNDRDDYVQINFENMQQDDEYNFKMDKYNMNSTEYYGVPYNYDSIMHYGPMSFSKNDKPTIEVLNNPNALGNGENIGQRGYLSKGDILMINRKYNCRSRADHVEPITETDFTTTTESANTTPDSISPPTTTTYPNPMCQYNKNFPGCKQY